MPNFGSPGGSADTVAAPGQWRISQMNEGTGVALDPDRPFNPPAHPKAWAVPPGGMGKDRAPQLLRGRISQWGVEKRRLPGSSRERSRSLNFLYNPNTITHTYSMDTSSIPPDYRPGVDKETPNLITGQSVAWKLYFNRQYDVVDPGDDPDRRNGVLADVQALERVMGSYRPGEGVAASPALVVFGASGGADGGVPFAYWGWISSLSVNYYQFTHRMIPTVAEVDIQLSRRMAPSGIDSGVLPTVNGVSGPYAPAYATNQNTKVPIQTNHGTLNDQNQQRPRSVSPETVTGVRSPGGAGPDVTPGRRGA